MSSTVVEGCDSHFHLFEHCIYLQVARPIDAVCLSLVRFRFLSSNGDYIYPRTLLEPLPIMTHGGGAITLFILCAINAGEKRLVMPSSWSIPWSKLSPLLERAATPVSRRLIKTNLKSPQSQYFDYQIMIGVMQFTIDKCNRICHLSVNREYFE